MVANEVQHNRPIGRAKALDLGRLEMLKINLAHYGFFRSDLNRVLGSRDEDLSGCNEISSQLHLEFIPPRQSGHAITDQFSL